jgi:hypothetical protein
MVAALLCGCHRIFPFDLPDAPADLGVAVDGAKGDVLKTDADAVMDLISPADGKLLQDGPQVDGPQVDGLPIDQMVTLTAPCSSKGKPLVSPVAGWDSSKMRLCQKIGNSTLTQCQAAALCNPAGWSLCEPGDYRKNGGDIAGTSITAWLKACIRSGGTSYAPMSKICGGCNITTASKTPTHWSCSGTSFPISIYKYVGLRTGDSCKRVGVNHTNNEGFWIPSTSSTSTTDGAVCCHP